MARSFAAGRRTSQRTPDVEILSVSPHGIWLIVRDHEYLLRYEDFPWFKEAKIDQIFDVKLLAGEHLHWPSLDVDLHVDSLADPARFPLVGRLKPRQRPARG